MAATARERLEDFATLFENPEISALAAISRILEDLPDDASRLRVMRWAFGKYGDEFKRPLLDAPAVTAPATVAPIVPVAPVAPVAKLARPVVPPTPPAPARPTIVPPAGRSDGSTAIEPADFDRQVAELNDLFGDRPDGLRLAKPRQ